MQSGFVSPIQCVAFSLYWSDGCAGVYLKAPLRDVSGWDKLIELRES